MEIVSQNCITKKVKEVILQMTIMYDVFWRLPSGARGGFITITFVGISWCVLEGYLSPMCESVRQMETRIGSEIYVNWTQYRLDVDLRKSITIRRDTDDVNVKDKMLHNQNSMVMWMMMN
eukprot:11393_1